jgi:hypothetical protein
VADRHSFSAVDLTPAQLTLRRISITREVIDEVAITKP